jgi:hypothetical protein
MKQVIVLALGLYSMAFFPMIAFGAAAPETAGQILARLSKLAPGERQKILIEKAKAEGEVSYYSSLQAQQLDTFVQLFQ